MSSSYNETDGPEKPVESSAARTRPFVRGAGRNTARVPRVAPPTLPLNQDNCADVAVGDSGSRRLVANQSITANVADDDSAGNDSDREVQEPAGTSEEYHWLAYPLTSGQCPLCTFGDRVYTIKGLQHHLRTIHADSLVRWRCRYCDTEEYSTKLRAMGQHQRSCRVRHETRHSVPNAGQGRDQPGTGSDPGTGDQLPCPHCGKVFRNSRGLGGHIFHAHPEQRQRAPLIVGAKSRGISLGDEQLLRIAACIAEYEEGVANGEIIGTRTPLGEFVCERLSPLSLKTTDIDRIRNSQRFQLLCRQQGQDNAAGSALARTRPGNEPRATLVALGDLVTASQPVGAIATAEDRVRPRETAEDLILPEPVGMPVGNPEGLAIEHPAGAVQENEPEVPREPVVALAAAGNPGGPGDEPSDDDDDDTAGPPGEGVPGQNAASDSDGDTSIASSEGPPDEVVGIDWSAPILETDLGRAVEEYIKQHRLYTVTNDIQVRDEADSKFLHLSEAFGRIYGSKEPVRPRREPDRSQDGPRGGLRRGKRRPRGARGARGRGEPADTTRPMPAGGPTFPDAAGQTETAVRPDEPVQADRPLTGKAKKRAEFSKLQRLFRTNRKLAVEHILSGMPLEAALPATEPATEAFRLKFSARAEVDSAPFEPAPPADRTKILREVTVKAVKQAQAKTKRKSASGPDKHLTARVVKRIPPRLLKRIFQCWKSSGRVPAPLKGARTVLLPKRPTGLEELNNWRPLTIGSCLLRLYCRILATDLGAGIDLALNQKAFVEGEGTSENVVILESVIRQSRRRGTACYIVFLDLSKAFDTVSHSTLMRALDRFSIPQQFKDLMTDLYDGAETTVHGATGPGDSIPMNAGVKQGCPLSPLLFNMIIDELIRDVRKEYGTDALDQLLAILGFADDVCLVSKSRRGMEGLLSKCETFFKARGLELNAGKSQSLASVPDRTRRSRASGELQRKVNLDPFRAGGQPIPPCKDGECAKYCGLNFGHAGRPKAQLDRLADLIGLVEKSRLRAHQKVDVLRVNILPKVEYYWTLERTNRRVLIEADTMIRKKIRDWLYLPGCYSSDLIHLPTRHGGLGVRSLNESIPVRQVRMLTRLERKSRDPLVRQVVRLPEWAATRNLATEILGKSIGAVMAPSLGRVLQSERRARFVNSTQGLGHEELFSTHTDNHPVLMDGASVWGSSRYSKCLKLLSNTYPTLEVLCRGRPDLPKSCRLCQGPAIETIQHISNVCPQTKGLYRGRHNKVCEVVARALRGEQYTVTTEPEFRVYNPRTERVEGRVPDMVAVKDGRACVVEVTVPYERGGQYLDARLLEKRNKYVIAVPEVIRTFGVESVECLALVVGARGGWCAGNSEAAEKLPLSRKTQANMRRTALIETVKLMGVAMMQARRTAPR